jgi:hypothetical protein
MWLSGCARVAENCKNAEALCGFRVVASARGRQNGLLRREFLTNRRIVDK